MDASALFMVMDELGLTLRELRIYNYLYDNSYIINKPRTRKELIENCWGGKKPTTRCVDVHIRRLRGKLKHSKIQTIHNEGYRLINR